MAIRKFDVLILGAGAAGLLCAAEAGKRGRRVAIIERADRAGKKILISGGGRCNFTNIYSQPDNFVSSNPHFAKSALARYTPADFIALVEKHGIPYHEKTLGQLFCDRSASDITEMLELECRNAGVKTFLNYADSRGSAHDGVCDSYRSGRISARRCWWLRPADSRSPKWAPPLSATTLRGNSG